MRRKCSAGASPAAFESGKVGGKLPQDSSPDLRQAPVLQITSHSRQKSTKKNRVTDAKVEFALEALRQKTK
jgi:hypothetical protein